MRFSFVAAVTAAMAVVNVQALTYRAYSSTTQCSGENFSFNDGGAVCSSIPAGFGFSVQFENLPTGTQGQGYTGNTCAAFLFSVIGSGTKCWNGGGSRATHANWFHSPSGSVVASAKFKRTTEECKGPTAFSYTDLDGQAKEILIDATIEDHAEKIAALYANKDYAALAAF